MDHQVELQLQQEVNRAGSPVSQGQRQPGHSVSNTRTHTPTTTTRTGPHRDTGGYVPTDIPKKRKDYYKDKS